MIKCISFDFDGTLATVMPLTHHLIPKLLAQKGIDVSIEEFMQQCIKLRNNLPDYLREPFRKYGSLTKRERDEFIQEYNKARIDMLKLKGVENIDELKNWLVEQLKITQRRVLYDDVKETIVYLKERGFKLFILSGNHSDEITELLKEAELLHFFEEIITVDKYQTKKVENFKHLIELANVSSEEILHIGDEYVLDGKAPSELGIHVLLIRRPSILVFDECDKGDFITIESLLEVFPYLQTIKWH